MHYVAPTVWAWRPGRAQKMARHVDQVLALLPFEPPYMEAAGIACDFVGHPVVTEPVADDAEAAAFRAGMGVAQRAADPRAARLAPGRGRAPAPVFGEASARWRRSARLRGSCALRRPAVGQVRAATADWAGPAASCIDPRARIRDGNGKRAAFRAADVALAASGTVSLELAAAGTPMVIAYDMNWLVAQIIGRMLLTDTVTLVNLVSETRAVPEFIGRDLPARAHRARLLSVLTEPEAQHAAMARTMERLGRGGEAPGLRAARAVLDGLARGAGRPH